MTQLLAIIRNEIRLFRSDRRGLIMMFVIPIGIGAFMGTLFNGPGRAQGLPRVDLALVDRDNSGMSRAVVTGFANDSNFRATVTNEEAARALVLAGNLPVAVILPEGFGENLLPGVFDNSRKPRVEVLYDPSRNLERPMVEGLLTPKIIEAVVQSFQSPDFAQEWIEKGRERLNSATGFSPEDRRRIAAMMDLSEERIARQANTAPAGRAAANTGGFHLPLPFSLHSEALAKPGAVYNGYAHSFAGMAIQFVLMAMVEFAVNLLREREGGLFRRLRAAPVSRATLLGGKTLGQAMIGAASIAVCMIFSMVVFGVRIYGSVVGFALIIAATSAMAGGFGLLIAALGKSAGGARGIAIALVLLLVMLGGAWAPTFIFPEWLQSISRATPVYWAIDSLDSMTWRGFGLAKALEGAAVLLAFAAVFAGVGLSRFKWEA